MIENSEPDCMHDEITVKENKKDNSFGKSWGDTTILRKWPGENRKRILSTIHPFIKIKNQYTKDITLRHVANKCNIIK